MHSNVAIIYARSSTTANTFIVMPYPVIRVCSWKRKKWFDISSGTRNATNHSRMAFSDVRRVIIAWSDSRIVLITASKPTTTVWSEAVTRSVSKLFPFQLDNGWHLWSIRCRCTLALRTCKCMPTITGKIRQSSRKDSNGSEPQRIVYWKVVPFLDRRRHTFTADVTVAITHLRIRLIWVSELFRFTISLFLVGYSQRLSKAPIKDLSNCMQRVGATWPVFQNLLPFWEHFSYYFSFCCEM